MCLRYCFFLDIAVFGGRDSGRLEMGGAGGRSPPAWRSQEGAWRTQKAPKGTQKAPKGEHKSIKSVIVEPSGPNMVPKITRNAPKGIPK